MSTSNFTSIVTGVCGMLGTNLALALRQQGHSVLGLDNFSTGRHENQKTLESAGVMVQTMDVCDGWGDLEKSIHTPLKWVFHFASPASPPRYQDLPLETLQVNSTGLLQALNFSEKHNARCIFASTSEIYGDPTIHPQTEEYWGNVNCFGPRSCYDEAKRFGEALIYSFNDVHKSNHGLIRIFNTYGPYMNPTDGRVVINFLLQAMRGETLTVYGDGQQTRSFCYVDDLVNGILLYAQSDETVPVNLGNDREFTLLELIDQIQSLMGDTKIKIKNLELPKDDPKQRRPDLSRAKTRLLWEPKIQLKAGLEKTIAWLQQENLV